MIYRLHSWASFVLSPPVCEGILILAQGCGCSSAVEHDLAKVGVEGSIPFARSILFNDIACHGVRKKVTGVTGHVFHPKFNELTARRR